jgi:GNAT superfamily N-acetyltransferase
MPHLSEALLDSIIFSMEDQVTSYFIDLKNEQLITEDERSYILEEEGVEDNASKRFLPIPDWTPTDGFRLMEKFASTVRNPAVQRRLISALESGKGVFRKFKDELSEQPILERKWYTFKDEQLKRVVVSWYRELEGALSLEHLPPEPEEYAEDILLEDFSYSAYEGLPTDEMEALIQATLNEMHEGSDEDRIGSLLLSRQLECERIEHYMVARACDGSLAAILLYTPITDDVVHVPFFTVAKPYRGLGLFRLLFDAFSRQMARFHYSKMVINLAGEAIGLEKYFSPYKARNATKQLTLSTESWNLLHPSLEEAFL